MTVHPIDTDSLRREALGQLGRVAADPRWPGRVLSLLDALADAEQRATRAEEKVSEQKALRMKAVAAVTEAEVREEQLLLRNRNLLDALKQAEADRDWLFRSSRLSKMERIKANARADRAEAQVSEEKRLRMKATAAATEAEAERDAARRQYDEDTAYWIAATDTAEAQIKAVRDVLDNIDTSNDPALHDGFADIRRALDGDA